MTISEKDGAMAKSGLAERVLEKKSTEKRKQLFLHGPVGLCPRETPSGGKGTLWSVLGSRKRHELVSAPKNPTTLHSTNLTLSSSWQGQVIC